jgi:acyl-CoA dehydrogenase
MADQAILRVLMCEEIGYGDAALFVALPGPGLAEPVLRAFGSPEQQKRFFGVFQEATPKWGAFAMTEPQAGSDVAALSTTAIKRGDRYIINGRKWFIGNGGRADWVVVFATVDPKMGQFGIRAFVVERGAPGFRVGQVLPTMGMKALQPAELIFEDCEVSEENLLGGAVRSRLVSGFQAGMRTFHLMRPGVAAMAVGAGRSAIELLEEELRSDDAPRASAQRRAELGRRIEAMRRKLDAARLLCWNAACIYDAGRDNSREASMAKALCATVAMQVCGESLELVAAAGVSDEKRLSELDRIVRNTKVFAIVEGTTDIQRLTVLNGLLRRKE